MTAASPPFSVAQETTPDLSFAQALDTYAHAGAEGIGIDIATLTDPAADLERFRASGLRATFCSLPVSTILPPAAVPGLAARPAPDDPRERVSRMCAGLERLAPFAPAGCLCTTGPCGAYGADEAWELAVEGLRRLADAAGEREMLVAVEPMDPSLAGVFGFVTDLPAAARLVADVGAPNVRAVVDMWHLGGSGTLAADVRAHADVIGCVHVNDRAERPRSWCDRLLPGDGVAGVPGVLAALDEAGYAGWFELEVISDDGRCGTAFPDSLWTLDPLELVRRGRARFLEAWTRRSG